MIMIAAQATDAQFKFHTDVHLFSKSWSDCECFTIIEELFRLKTTTWTQKLQEQLGKKPHVKWRDCGLLDGIQLNVPASPFISPAAPF
jgi:hypothetical protein